MKTFKRLSCRLFTAILFSGFLFSSFIFAMSIEEMERAALGQGMSPAQIEEMKNRYRASGPASGMQQPQPAKWSNEQGPRPSQYELPTDTIDTLAAKTDTLKADSLASDSIKLPYFGYKLFSTVPDAFKPTAIGPVDPGYLIGPGDVLRLAVWGQAEFQYELTVSNEGKILVPVAGQVHVSGIPFEQLQTKLKTLLSRHYSGLTTNPPRTFMDLTVARLKPIRVYIMGEVHQPGGYTVSSFGNAFSALYSVGGPLERGSLREISVIRNDSTVATVDIYDYLLSGRSRSDIRLQNNDIVFVPPRGKTVSVSGSVVRPAVYELKKDDNLQALLAFCGGLLPASNIDRAHIRRVLPFDQRSSESQMTKVVDINLKEYLQSKQDFTLYNNDSLHITPLYDDLRNFVTLSGAVQYPGVYQCDSITLKDLIFKQGKLIDNKSFTKRADLIRLNEDRVTTSIYPVNLQTLGSDETNQKLLPGDEVIVYEMDVEKPTELSITVDGEVRRPGAYTMSSNMTVTDAILRAGGFTKKALRRRVDVYRPDLVDESRLAQVFQVELPDSVDYSSPEYRKLRLTDRDRIVVRPDPNYKEDHFVTITGYVKYAGTYALEGRDERLSTILERAGGIMPDAYLKGATIIRNGKRVVVDFESAYLKRRTKEDLILQKADSIYIPSRPNNVFVHGQVNNEGLYGYIPNYSLGDYIDRAGGLADSASYVLITLPNGEVQKKRAGGWFRDNPKIPDGSQIFVTKKLARPPNANGPSVAEIVRDTLAIITSAVTLVVLAKQL